MDFSGLDKIPAGQYAVGVSGGGDSTALLLLLRQRRPDVRLHVVHLNHQTRGQASELDARFVTELADWMQTPVTIGRRSEMEGRLQRRPRNAQAFYRQMRLRLFADVARENSLAGVLLAHHAEDQAETVLQRLLRGSGVVGLAGMAEQSKIHVDDEPLILRRPLLEVHRSELREYLTERGQMWREDASNASMKYTRNRLRRLLESEPGLVDGLLAMGSACRAARDWARAEAPKLDEVFSVGALRDLPRILGEVSAKRYLRHQGCPPDALTPAVVDRLMQMAADAASPSRQNFPGNVTLRRRAGKISKRRMKEDG